MRGWQKSAACAGLTLEESERLFFPGPGRWDSEASQAAVELCRSCLVWSECRDLVEEVEGSSLDRAYAVGIYAGERPSQRIARRRRAREEVSA